jgi:hypothetical protein
MTKVDEQLRCGYCEVFFPYDMSKDWLDYIYKKSYIVEKEKDHGVQTIPKKLPKTSGGT